MNKTTSSLALALASLLAPSAYAQVIVVGWGGDTVSQAVELNRFTPQTTLSGINVNPSSRAGRLTIPPGTDALSNDSTIGITFDEANQLSPTSNYTGQRFCGGLSASLLGTLTPPAVDRAQISNSGNNDVLDFRYSLNSTQHDSRLAIFFDKIDFLGGGNLQPVQLGANSSLSIRFNANTSNQVNNDGELRWMVRESGQWWISAANAAGQPNIRSQDDAGGSNGIKNNTTFTSTFASGALNFWAPFDPVTGGGLANLNFEPSYTSRFVIDPSLNPFVAKSFADITGIGFYIEGDQFSTNVFQFEVETINFNVLVIPEPTTYALIGTMGLGYFSLRNLRKKKAALPQQPDDAQPAVVPETTPVAAQ